MFVTSCGELVCADWSTVGGISFFVRVLDGDCFCFIAVDRVLYTLARRFRKGSLFFWHRRRQNDSNSHYYQQYEQPLGLIIQRVRAYISTLKGCMLLDQLCPKLALRINSHLT